jgi:hypothetical protein
MLISFYRFEECACGCGSWIVFYPDGILDLEQGNECPQCHKMTTYGSTPVLTTGN